MKAANYYRWTWVYRSTASQHLVYAIDWSYRWKNFPLNHEKNGNALVQYSLQLHCTYTYFVKTVLRYIAQNARIKQSGDSLNFIFHRLLLLISIYHTHKYGIETPLRNPFENWKLSKFCQRQPTKLERMVQECFKHVMYYMRQAKTSAFTHTITERAGKSATQREKKQKKLNLKSAWHTNTRVV